MISVIVPAYNVAPYLDKCVSSIIQQTYKDLEIILVDDGSTDETPALCDMWTLKDHRIQVIHKPNGGLSSARNAGIDVAKGEILSFIDSDDFIESKMYESMLSAMEETGMDIACCGRIEHLYGGNEKVNFNLPRQQCFIIEEAMKKVLCHRVIDVSACDKLYRKSLFDNVRYPVGKTSEDQAVIFRLFDRANGVVHVDGNFYHYVYHKESISKSDYSHKRYDCYENNINIISYMKKFHPDLVPYAKIAAAETAGVFLSSAQINPKIRNEYPTDFSAFDDTFKAYFLLAIVKIGLSWKEKLLLIFVRIGRYDLFIRLKKLMHR